MSTLDDRVRALEPFGFTPRQTRFLATVALHSGYCLRRQYAACAGIRYGKNVCDFLDALVAARLATRFIQRADRGHIYHLQARALYRALGQEDSPHRRQASAALIARRLMVLDYVLAHPDLDWLATEADKVAVFAGRFGIPSADLPQRRFGAPACITGTTRYFPHHLPVTVSRPAAVPQFVYLVTEISGLGFERFLTDHARLFAALSAWQVVAVGIQDRALEACRPVFAQFLLRRSSGAPELEDLRWFFVTRRTIDQGNLAHLSASAIDRFRALRDTFSGSAFEGRYAAWRTHGDRVLAPSARPGGSLSRPSVGELMTERLTWDYSQFGSLPGVA